MFSSTPFYHQCIRKTVIAFGSLFNDIHVTGGTDERIRVPLAYAPKQKWYSRIKDGKLEDGRTFSMTLPRMGFEVINYTYDPSRKRNTIMQTMKNSGYDTTNKDQKYRYAEVPYNVSFGMYAFTSSIDENLQIIEQITPFFAPEFIVSINMNDAHEKVDVPIVLSNINIQEEYEGNFATRRFISTTFEFLAKSYMYGPVKTQRCFKK